MKPTKKESDICLYTQHKATRYKIYDRYFKTDCGHELGRVLKSFKFCPFCGRKLKVLRMNQKGELLNEFFD